MLLLPLAAAWPIYLGFRPTGEQLSAVITAVSIYSALLFGILIPAGDQAKRMKDELGKASKATTDDDVIAREKTRRHLEVARDILSNVSFSIVVSVLNVLILVIALCVKREGDAPVEHRSYSWLLGTGAYLFAFLLIQLFIIVRSVYGSWMTESD